MRRSSPPGPAARKKNSPRPRGAGMDGAGLDGGKWNSHFRRPNVILGINTGLRARSPKFQEASLKWTVSSSRFPNQSTGCLVPLQIRNSGRFFPAEDSGKLRLHLDSTAPNVP